MPETNGVRGSTVTSLPNPTSPMASFGNFPGSALFEFHSSNCVLPAPVAQQSLGQHSSPTPSLMVKQGKINATTS